jgi:septum formation protein
VRLVLASTSRYRAELLGRLRVAFDVAAPGVGETPRQGESAVRLSARLALAKAEAVAAQFPGCWVLGSDQAVACDDKLLGKPGTPAANREQLTMLSGRSADFATAIALIGPGAAAPMTDLDVTVVRFRHLDAAEIARYVEAEPAIDCAGGFKVEGLGISLFDEVASKDPTALVGLPLIATRRLLSRAGFAIP